MKYTKEELRMQMLAGIITEGQFRDKLEESILIESDDSTDMNLSSSNPEHAIFKYNLGPKIGHSTKTAYIYKDNPNFIIKDFDKDFYNAGIEIEYELSKKYPNLFANTLKFDLENNIIIQEKLDTSKVSKDEIFFKSKYGIKLNDAGNEVFYDPKEVDHYPLEYYENIINDPNDFKIFKKYYDFYQNLKNAFDTESIPIYHRVAHIANVGFDKKGNLKVFDLD